MTKPKGKNWTKLFETLGATFPDTSGVEAVADQCCWCGKEDHLYVNAETGEYDCKSCGESGNAYGFIRFVHREALERTAGKHYQRLAQLRGIPVRTLKRHCLAYDEKGEEWLIPFKNRDDEVLNLQRYLEPSGNKYDLPCLHKCLYGVGRLSNDVTLPLFLCEGPFDAIALDSHLTKAKSRSRYDILAVPGASSFPESWFDFFRNRTVRIVFDNDNAGRMARSRVAKKLIDGRVASEVTLLQWPADFPEKCDINDLVRNHSEISIPQFVQHYSTKYVPRSRLRLRPASEFEQEKATVEWLWPQHIPCRSYVTFFGRRGTYKSTIARDLVACVTAGRAMPDGQRGVGASDVIYFTSEDPPDRVVEDVKRYRGDLNRLLVQTLETSDGQQLNLLDSLDELAAVVAERKVKLIIIDAQNSFVGAPDITTDMKGRYNVSNRLHAFAQQTGVCLIGIRNTADDAKRALGSQSMSDISRCIFQTLRLQKKHEPPRFWLAFEKVNDAPEDAHPSIPFTPKDCGGHRRRILWGKVKEQKAGSKTKRTAKKNSKPKTKPRTKAKSKRKTKSEQKATAKPKANPKAQCSGKLPVSLAELLGETTVREAIIQHKDDPIRFDNSYAENGGAKG